MMHWREMMAMADRYSARSSTLKEMARKAWQEEQTMESWQREGWRRSAGTTAPPDFDQYLRRVEEIWKRQKKIVNWTRAEERKAAAAEDEIRRTQNTIDQLYNVMSKDGSGPSQFKRERRELYRTQDQQKKAREELDKAKASLERARHALNGVTKDLTKAEAEFDRDIGRYINEIE